ncbi:MAG: sulfatase [Phycisphaerales bacterium]|nr:sulfatase [Phycisphaerales bacterium]
MTTEPLDPNDTGVSVGEAESPAPPPRPPLWSRAVLTSLAVGVLVGLAEVCWSYRLTSLSPDWRSSLPVTIGGLAFFVVIAVVIDVCIMLVGGLLWACAVAVWRDVTAGDKPIRDRRLGIPWFVLTMALSYLWVGWVGLFIFPSTAMHSKLFRVTLIGGVVALFAVSLFIAWSLRRLHRVHRRLPTVCWAIAAVILLLFTLPAYSRVEAKSHASVDIPLGVEGARPNVLLVTLDTVRFDFLPFYGRNTWIQTPTLSALAAEGIIFDQAISQAPTTTPSHCSIMTSVYPSVHDAMNGKPMRSDLITLAQCMRENGYETVAFTSSTTTRSINSGLDRGFDRYVDSLVSWSEIFSRDEFQNLLAFYMLGIVQNSQIRGDVVTSRALNWLAQRDEGPFFCWQHYFDPHDPYDPPPPYDEMYKGQLDSRVPLRAERERYAGEITYTDYELGKVIASLKERGLYDEMLIVIVSDHGEGFGEQHWDYTERQHGDHLYDTTQRVPLIIKLPRSISASRSRMIRSQIELIDIAPTILAFANLPIPASFGGRSLARVIQGAERDLEQKPAHAMAWVEVFDPKHPDKTGTFVRKLAHRTSDWKYVLVNHYNQEELYDLRRDPGESTNLSKTRPEICAERQTEVKALVQNEAETRDDPRARLAPALRKQLEALGYLGGDSQDDSDGE